MQKIGIGKATASFQTLEFLEVKQYKYFNAKLFEWQSDCIVSKHRIFKGEAIQVLLRRKICLHKAIVSL
jgi:hypothetical protein